MRFISLVAIVSFLGTTYAQSSSGVDTTSNRLASTSFIPNFGSTTSFTGVTSIETTVSSTVTSASTSQVTSSRTQTVTSGGMTMTTVVPIVSNSVSSTTHGTSMVSSVAVSTTATKTGAAAVHTAHVAGAAMIVLGGAIYNML